MTNSTDEFRALAERFSQILRRSDGRWQSPTPCENWTVADVVAHVLDTQRDFLARQDLDPGTLPEDASPRGRWQAHADHVIAVLQTDGVADQAFDGYFGPTTIGDTMANFYGWDLAIHGWDIARATGQDDPISDAEARELMRGAEGWGPALYSEGICAPALPVSDDARDHDKLLAMLGRDPRWGSA